MRRIDLILPALLVFAWCCPAATPGDTLLLKNQHTVREFHFDGQTWKTTRIARTNRSASLATQSDELLIVNLEDTNLTLDAFQADGEPAVHAGAQSGEQSITIPYVLKAGAKHAGAVPSRLWIRYALSAEGILKKTITLNLPAGSAIDRLEVERLSVPADAKASRGGRGEPVFIVANDAVFFMGIEYPAAYSRHTDGNTPIHASGPYDKAGNYSFIDLESRDIDRNPRPGLIRLFHFPGLARPIPDSHQAQILSKTAVIGIGKPGDSPELAFRDYLDTIKRPTRSFIHYNNWYHPEGKKLTVENFVKDTYLPFKRQLEPYGVTLHAMVPDDGWQNRKSIYEPSPAHFPNGLPDLVTLSRELEAHGTRLGLWIALNGYNSDIDWGVAQGFVEAQRNERFSLFKRYYSITDPKYFAVISRRLTDLIQKCNVQYFKHDFNELCDLTGNTGHLPSDRHGHEASVDAQLALLKLERELNPSIYQNVTNWIWFSPWWLAHTNNLWMLSSDTGEFTGIPEISTLIRAAAYRDVHLHRIFSDPHTRPLVPVSNLMTHGIIYTRTKYARAGDSLRDFCDYVMMYYSRGTQLKEWYIDPHLLTDEQWQALARATRWSEQNLEILANAVKVGGDPAKAQTYGYIAWLDDRALLSLRNPSPLESQVTIPFDGSVWYRGRTGRTFHARMIYPYQAGYSGDFTSGQPMTIAVPAYTLLTLEIAPGAAPSSPPTAVPLPPEVKIAAGGTIFTLPDEQMLRADLLLIRTDPAPAGERAAHLPQFQLNGEAVAPIRTATSRDWSIACVDLRQRAGQPLRLTLPGANTRAYLVLDRPVKNEPADADPRLPMPIAQGYRRQSVPLVPSP